MMPKRSTSLYLLLGIVLLAWLVWCFRPVSWRTFHPAQAISSGVGLAVWQTGEAALPGWFSWPELQQERTHLLSWCTGSIGLDLSGSPHFELIQDTGPAGLALTLVIDIGRQDERLAVWEEQVPSERVQTTRYAGFSIQEYRHESVPLYYLHYGNLLIVGRLALVVEEALAHLLQSGDRTLPADWTPATGTPVYFVQGHQLARYTGVDPLNASTPWLLALEHFFPQWSRIEPTDEGCIIETKTAVPSFANAPVRDTLARFIPRDAVAWLRWSGTLAGDADSPWRTFAQQHLANVLHVLVPGITPDRPGRIWMTTTPDTAARTTAWTQLRRAWPTLQQTDYLTFQLTELRVPPPPDRCGRWPKAETTWYTTLGELTLLADSRRALEKWVNAYVLGQLQPSLADQQMAEPVFFARLAVVPPFLSAAQTGVVSGTLQRTGGYTRLRLTIDSDTVEQAAVGSELAWQTELETAVATAPRAVHHPDGRPTGDLLVQDNGNRLYLLDERGAVVWSKLLTGRLVSEVWQVGDREPIYVLSTETSWGLLDGQGDWLPDYPIPLANVATAGLQLIDFDGRGEYRVLIPLTGGLIQGYRLDGTPLSAWNPRYLGEDVTHPIQHFQFGYRDYLLATDRSGVLHILDREGRPRFDSLPPLEGIRSRPFFQVDAAAQRIAVLDSTGRVRAINMEGASFPLVLHEGGAIPRWFAFAPLTAGPRYDYLGATPDRFWVKAYTGTDFGLAFAKKPSHRIDTLFVLPAPEPPYLIGALDKERRLFSVWRKDQLLRTDMPLAGDYPCVWLGGQRYATAFDRKVLTYVF